MIDTPDFFQTTARRILNELAVTDTLPTPQSIRMVLKEDVGRHLTQVEITGVIL